MTITPKQDAVKLMNQMRLPCGTYLDADGEPKNNYKVLKNEAKECALVAINWILNETNVVGEEREHYEKVKKELENLRVR